MKLYRHLPWVTLFTLAPLVTLEAHARDGTPSCYDGESEKYPRVIGHTTNGLACEVDWWYAGVNHGYTSFGQICNTDPTRQLMVNCPLHRTEVRSLSGLTCASATLVYQNGNLGPDGEPCSRLIDVASYKCLISSRDATGWSGWYWGYANPPYLFQDTGGGIFAADFVAKILKSHYTDDTNLKGGSYTLTCLLPPTGGHDECGGQTCVSLLKWFEAEQDEQ